MVPLSFEIFSLLPPLFSPPSTASLSTHLLCLSSLLSSPHPFSLYCVCVSICACVCASLVYECSCVCVCVSVSICECVGIPCASPSGRVLVPVCIFVCVSSSMCVSVCWCVYVCVFLTLYNYLHLRLCLSAHRRESQGHPQEVKDSPSWKSPH